MFTAKRTVRDGYLIAFEGEQMSEEEAERRGLIGEKPKRKPKKQSAKSPEETPENEN